MTKIVAECCNNHMGDRRVMETMIKALADVGVDAAKFQSFRAHKLRHDYPDYEREYAYYKSHELSVEDHAFLMDRCEHYGIEFITTVFDLDFVDTLRNLGLKTVKIASPDANSWRLIDKCLANFDRVLISTGMHTVDEKLALEKHIWLKNSPAKTTMLHCVSGYPVALADVNMEKINLNLLGRGYSDHTQGTDAGKLAIALGADVLECHFTLNPYLPGRDQAFAKTVDDMRELVEWNRTVALMMGKYNAPLTEQELANKAKYCGRWGDNR